MTDTVTVTTNPSTNTVEIVSVGPQGPQGPQGVKGDVGDVNPDMITLRDAAAASASAAASSASSASTSATTATSQASSASGSASTATSQATTATNQATTATTKAGEASTSATNAAASASTASSSASTATTKASEASTSANNASGSASTAISQATIATTKAAEADASATAAAGSASSASASASTASTQATNAANSASTATSAAATATTQATNASNSATTATTKANDAANSAASVGASATTASTQAGLAIASANSAAASASSVGTAAATATAKASEAASSAAAINATFGNAASVAALAQNAQAAASLAQGYAASASSVIQQDLSGVTAQALHRSPNAVTAMSIYDTSKDSDGGAWTKRCQQTSWYNEALAGKWLGPQISEFEARNSGATLGSELITNGDFATDTNWTKGAGWTISGGAASFSSGTGSELIQTGLSFAANTTYKITFDMTQVSGGGFRFIVDTTGSFVSSYFTTTASHTLVFSVGATSTRLRLGSLGGASFSVDNISVKEVTALTTASNDYFQLTTDGKFYRLWKNLFSNSDALTSFSVTPTTGLTSSLNAGTAPNGASIARLLTNTTTNELHRLFLGTTLVSGSTYTYSVYARRDTADWMQLSFNLGTSATAFGNFNLATGAKGTEGGTGVATITPVGGGWYRCTLTAITGGTNCNVQLYVLEADPGQANPGNTGTGKGIFVYGAQLEYGSTATTYEPKTAEGTTSEIFRGNKADFPRLAAIVAEAGNVSIYDLTEPGRPMWMRFLANSMQYAIYGNVNSVAAMNGVMAVGTSGGYNPVDFAKDSSDIIRQTNQGLDRKYPQIALRNAADGTLFTNTPKTPVIVNNTVNAVAMTVLPDAPIDPATGLRVPTIAVATSGGVSVIKHNGTVVSTASANSFHHVYIDRNILMYSRTGDRWVAYALNPGSLGASFAQILMGTNPDEYQSANPVIERFSGRSAPIRFISPTVKRKWNNEALPTRGLNMSVAPTYNTGWMTGDIRRAYLSDVTAESIVGSELVTNGDFSGGTTGWTGGSGATISIVSGGLLVDDPTSAGFANQAITTIANRYYKITAQFVAVTAAANPNLWVGTTNLTSNLLSAVLPIGATGTITGYFQATGTTSYLSIGYIGTGQNVTIDNISVREVVADRSYKAQGASINGTLTKAQLASGTSLVGYSGFSASNYLREPYSADLDFGTGEFTASAWANIPVTIDPATRALGPELLADPSFDNPASWTLNTGASITGSQLIFSSVGSTLGAYSVANISSAGRVYAVTLVVSAVTAGQFRVRMASGALVLIPASAGTYTIYCTSDTGASGPFNILATGTTSGVIDSVTVKEVANCFIFDRAFSSGPRLQLLATPAGNLSAVAFDGTTTRTVTTTTAYNTATWLKARVRYTTDGSLAITVNGREVAATRGTPLLTMNNSSAVLTIGNSYALDAPFPGSIALLKMGATVPTTEQAQFMYEQEKQLFRAGAQSVLPDSGAVLDMAYDDATDRWVAVSGTNESYWTGLVRNSVTPVPAGTYTRIVANSGVELNSRITTNPGVDVSIPAYGLREELVRRAEAASRLGKELTTYDFVGGFTGNITNGSTAIASVSGLTYPTSYIGARISGTGIPTNATIVAVSGTTIYISAAATATTSTLSITFLDFILPAGMEAKTVMSAGAVKQEGSTKDYTRLYDGFLETIRFAAAPGVTAWVQIQAQRISQ